MWAFAAAFAMLQGVVGFVQGRGAASAQEKISNYQATLAGRQADAMEQEAGQTRARAQRQAIADRRQGSLARSRAVAAMAGSGTMVDPTMLGDLDTEIELRALQSMSEGEDTARGIEYDALLTRRGAQTTREAGGARADLLRNRAAGTLIGGVGMGAATLWERYGKPRMDDEPQSQSYTQLAFR